MLGGALMFVGAIATLFVDAGHRIPREQKALAG
jgi:maltose/moltooligosaccharide transporter